MRYKNIPKGRYKSKLEAYTGQQLQKNNLWFRYEPKSFLLWPGRAFPESLERKGKKMRCVKRERSISYTPDFIGKNWIIETKGIRTKDFNMRWKLFKEWLQENELNYYLYLPSTPKDVDLCIKHILTLPVKESKSIL